MTRRNLTILDIREQEFADLQGRLDPGTMYRVVDTTGRPIRTVTADGQVVGGGVTASRTTGRKTVLAFGNSIAAQSSTYMFTGTSRSTADVRAGANQITVPSGQGALFSVNDRVAVSLFTGEVWKSTITGITGDMLTFSGRVPKYVRNSSNAFIQRYTTDQPTSICRDWGELTAAVAMLGGCVDVVQGYSFGGAITSQMMLDLPAWIKAVKPDYIYFRLPDNDVNQAETLPAARYRAMAEYACRLCVTNGVTPLLATPVPNAFGGTAASPVANAARAAWWDEIVAWTLQISQVVPGAIAIDTSQWRDTAQAANTRSPLASFATDGIHPNPSARFSVGALVAPQLPPDFSDALAYNEMRDATPLRNPLMAGTGGTRVNTSSGVASGSVADDWVAEASGSGVTLTCSKNTDGSQKLVFAVAGTGNQSSTTAFFRRTETISLNYGNNMTLRGLIKARINALSGINMVLAQVLFDTGELYTTPQDAFFVDAAVVGRTLVMETPDVPVPSNATNYTLRLWIRPATGSTNPVADIDVIEAFTVPGAVTQIVA